MPRDSFISKKPTVIKSAATKKPVDEKFVVNRSAIAKSATPPPTAKILLVEDDRATRLTLYALLAKESYTILEAENGKEALDLINSEKTQLDAILLDHIMPKITGIELLKLIKKIPKIHRIPVVMITAHDIPEQVQQAIDAGIFYYLVKPVKKEILHAVVSAAVRESTQRKKLISDLEKQRASFHLIDRCKFNFRTLAEAESLACFIAGCFPEPERTLSGIAELLINSVEHGNCGITYDEKTMLINKGTWRQEVMKRVELPKNKKKLVRVKFWKEEDGFYVRIADEGQGFKWKKYLTIDPARSKDNHGRGIAQANMVSFDSLTFNKEGNQVIGFVKNSSLELMW